MSPSWENREKFAESREKLFRISDGRLKYGYTISSYPPPPPPPPPTAPEKKNATRNLTNFCKVLTCSTHFIFALQGKQLRSVLTLLLQNTACPVLANSVDPDH